MVFIEVITPVFLIVCVGWIFGKLTKAPVETPALLTLYIFIPCLFFISMMEAKLDAADYLLIFAYSIILFFLATGVVLIVARFAKYGSVKQNALVLSSCFPNSGNYGLPIILFAFTETGFDRALIFAVTQVFLVNSAGVFFASHKGTSIIQSLKRILGFPGFIAIIAAIILRTLEIEIPILLIRPLRMLGQAAIPTLLIMLGLQLEKIHTVPDLSFVSLASIIKLIVYPLIGFVLTVILFGGNDLTSKVLLVISAAPAGVSPTLLAVKYNTEPQLVSAVTFVTTIASIFTVSLLLWIVGV